MAVGRELLTQDAAQRLLGRTVRRAVAVSVVEMSNTQVEGVQDDAALGLERIVSAELLPQPEGEGRQVEPGRAGTPVGQLLVAVLSGQVHALVVGERVGHRRLSLSGD
jgi:hypothetical protein